VRWANLYVDSIGDTGQALAITAGSNNVNVTAGTLALTGAQTISSTLGVTGLITASGGVSGALTGNVTGGTISGTTGTFSGDVAVDTDTLFVDVSEGRVGVNAGTTPGAALDVAHTGTSAAFRVYNSQATDPYGILIDNTAANLSDANYVADFRVGGYSILRLNNSGQMTFAPNSYGGVSAGTLTVKTGSINSDSIRLEAGGTTSTWLESRGYLGHSWYVDSTRSMTLDSTGLGISTTSPSTLLHLNENYGTAALSISDDSSAGDYLTFQIVGGQYNGGANEIQAINTTDLSLNVATARSLIFKTNNTERARIDSSGRFIIGTNGYGGDTFNVSNGGAEQLEIGTSSGYANFQSYNRSGSAYIATEFRASEIRFDTGSSPAERVRITSDGLTFNGDTAAANALDDYEEGTWTPTFTPSTSGSITLAAGGGAYYTKIGQLVTATLSVTVASVSSPIGYVSVNLPFAPNTSNQKGRSAVAVYVDGLTAGHNTRDAIALIEDSSASLRIYQGDSNSNQSDFAQAVGAGTYFNLTVSYIV